MRLSVLRRLITEDFDKKEQPLVSKIAYVINPVFESLSNLLNNSLTFDDNFNAQVKVLSVKVDSSGAPIGSLSFRSTLRGTCQNLLVTRAQNQENTAVYPTSAPFIDFTDENGQITINHISGIQPNVTYSIRVLAFV